MGGKISDGRSVVVKATEAVTGGKFYEMEGFFGCAFADAAKDDNVALNLDFAEYETTQLTAEQTFAKGTKIYWDAANKKFTETALGNRFVGIVTVAKDADGVIWFVLCSTGNGALPQAANQADTGENAAAVTAVADAADAAGANPTAEEYALALDLLNDLKAKYNLSVTLVNALKADLNALLAKLKAAGLMAADQA